MYDVEGICDICGVYVIAHKRNLHDKWHKSVPEIVED